MSKKINVNKYIRKITGRNTKNNGRSPDERYASFDYCFNYFQSFRDKRRLADKKNLQSSCFHLGFYLASWGMMRGSSFLLQKSARNLSKTIKVISEFDKSFWDIDVDNYDKSNIQKLIFAKEKIRDSLKNNSGGRNPTDTLITKIMLGVFGNIPAFDRYFMNGLGVWKCGKKELLKIKEFYDEHKKEIDKHANEIKTFDFHSGKETKRKYTKAKIIDMVFFAKGGGE